MDDISLVELLLKKGGSTSFMDQITDVGDRNPDNSSMGHRNRSSGGTPAFSNGHSPCSSISPESPSRSELAAANPASESTFMQLNHLDTHGDDATSLQGAATGKKKKRAQRAVSGDKTGRGLRQFSMKVCEKVQSKGRTTYNEVADELVAEFAELDNTVSCSDQLQYDEKNIRRRVYDALNVLMAIDIISKDKKEIQWKGLPRTSLNDIEELKAERIALRNRIVKKTAYLRELQEQFTGLQNLVERNERLHRSGNAPSGGVALPFILIQTRPHATVEVEISEDMQLVHFDFNSTPFELRDDTYILKAMRLCERKPGEHTSDPMISGAQSNTNAAQNHAVSSSMPYDSGKLPCSPPVPGILKGRLKCDH